MLDTYKFTIPGDPFGKQRPKFCRRGKFVKAYTPKDTVNYESLVTLCFTTTHQIEPLTCPLKIAIYAFFQIPKSISKKKANEMVSFWIPRDKTPDIDNIAKSILDGLNSVAFVDDKQNYSISCSKWYDTKPRTVVEIIPFVEAKRRK